MSRDRVCWPSGRALAAASTRVGRAGGLALCVGILLILTGCPKRPTMTAATAPLPQPASAAPAHTLGRIPGYSAATAAPSLAAPPTVAPAPPAAMAPAPSATETASQFVQDLPNRRMSMRRSSRRDTILALRVPDAAVAPADRDSMINAELAKLVPGTIAYIVPEPMRVSTLTRVFAEIKKGVSTDLLRDLNDRGTRQTEGLKVGTVMKLQLVGDASEFDIRLEGGQEVRTINGDPPSRWTWQVVPHKSGSRELALIAFVSLKPPAGDEQWKDIEVFRKNITVEVNTFDVARAFVVNIGKDNWKWILGTIFGGGLFSGWAIRKTRRRRGGRAKRH